MNFLKSHQQNMAIGFFLLGLCILLGAFGAHGLEKQLTSRALKTYMTGITYHRLISFSWICLAIIQARHEKVNFSKCFILMFLGLILFCGNCYMYSLTQVKVYAQMMPLGGIFLAYAAFLAAFKLFFAKE